MPEDSMDVSDTQAVLPSTEETFSRLTFLKDILICSLGAYGGPEAHFGVFTDQLVIKRNYLSEDDLVELLALCSILPGPTSTQTIVSVGYKMGGPLLALLTMLVWSAPVLVVMTGLSFLYAALSSMNVSSDILKYIGPMAVGFIVLAAWRINKKVVVDKLTFVLMLASAGATYFVRSPWIFPLVLVIGGVVSIIASREKDIWNKTKLSPPWRYLVLFAIVAAGALIAAEMTQVRLLVLFENFYRYGYLVFGGGQVVVPVMHSELVGLREYMTDAEFLTGYGLVQGLPGPMFSFAAYAGGMAARGGSVLEQILGGVAGGVGIFLPGLLLIYFVYPVWENVKKIKAVQLSLKGIKGVAGGMIAAAAIILMQNNGFAIPNLAMMAATVVILATKKVPAPLVVVLAFIVGIIFQ